MSEKELDLRGMACPGPVVETKKAFEEAGWSALSLRLDSELARSNVRRFAEKRGATVEETEGGLRIVRGEEGEGEEKEQEKSSSACRPNEGCTLYLNSELMGHGDEALGQVLIRGFFKTLLDLSPRPRCLIFVNRGIFLCTTGSPVLDALKALKDDGAEILACGTCLDFYERKDELAVGRVSNMFEIVETLSQATRIVSP